MEGAFVFVMMLVPVAVGLAFFAFWLMMLIDCLRSDSPNKLVWVVLIIFIPLLGAILYRLMEYKKPRVTAEPAV